MASPANPPSASSPQTWRPVKTSQLPKGLELLADGGVRCGGQLLPGHVGFSNVSFEGMEVSKSPGPHVKLQVATDDGEYRYRFKDGKWYEPTAAAMPSEAPKVEATPAPRTQRIKLGYLVRRYWKWGMFALTALVIVAVTLRIRRLSEERLSGTVSDAERKILDALRGSETSTREELDAVSQELDRTLAELTGLKSDFSSHRDQLAQEKAEQREKAEQQAKELPQQSARGSGTAAGDSTKSLISDLQDTQAKVARLKSEFADLQVRIAEEESLRGARIARDGYLEAQRQADELLRDHDELATEVKAWHETIPPLRTNHAGRKLASQEESVRFFVAEYDKRRSSPESVAALRSEIQQIADFIRDTLASGPVSPPTDLKERLSAKRTEIEALLTEYRDSRRQIMALIERSADSAEVTLEQAIQKLALEDAEQRARAVAAEVEDVNRRRDELESERAREAAEGRLAQEAEQAEHDENLAEAKSGKVHTALKFFFTPGYLQPCTNGVERTTKKQPISLSGLQAVGALNDSTQGIQKLYFVVCHDQDKDRPRWGTETNVEFIDSKEFERLRTAQDYLLRLGDVLVELELLSP